MLGRATERVCEATAPASYQVYVRASPGGGGTARCAPCPSAFNRSLIIACRGPAPVACVRGAMRVRSALAAVCPSARARAQAPMDKASVTAPRPARGPLSVSFCAVSASGGAHSWVRPMIGLGRVVMGGSAARGRAVPCTSHGRRRRQTEWPRLPGRFRQSMAAGQSRCSRARLDRAQAGRLACRVRVCSGAGVPFRGTTRVRLGSFSPGDFSSRRPWLRERRPGLNDFG
jgi:hypothetical protein